MYATAWPSRVMERRPSMRPSLPGTSHFSRDTGRDEVLVSVPVTVTLSRAAMEDLGMDTVAVTPSVVCSAPAVCSAESAGAPQPPRRETPTTAPTNHLKLPRRLLLTCELPFDVMTVPSGGTR